MKPKNTSGKTKKKENKQVLQPWILGLVIVQLIISAFIILPMSGNNNDSSIDNTQIEEISEKVERLDSFFASNAPGYGDGSTAQPPSQGSAPSGQKVEVSADDDPWLGSEDAKVTVIEFSDYQCPFCRKYWTESYPQLKEEYIDTGKIKYVFRDFPLGFHPSATLASVAGNCVAEQKGNDGYFEFHDIAFSEQAKQGQGTIQFTEDDVMSWVEQIDGIDKTKFDQCYNDPAQKAEVDADLAAGTQAGVSGTPSFFINGEMLVGAQPYSVIKATIEKALNE
jgi:protein-disulfide isomerase